MSTQHFQRHNKGVLHKIVVHHPVEHLNRAVVARRREQRVPLVISDTADRSSVGSQDAVRFGGKVHVEPADALIEASDDEIVAAGVDVDGRDPLDAGLERFVKLLLDEIVDSDIALGLSKGKQLASFHVSEKVDRIDTHSDEKERLPRMEQHLLHGPL